MNTLTEHDRKLSETLKSLSLLSMVGGDRPVGLAIGVVGGALPAIAATHLPPTAALRARG